MNTKINRNKTTTENQNQEKLSIDLTKEKRNNLALFSKWQRVMLAYVSCCLFLYGIQTVWSCIAVWLLTDKNLFYCKNDFSTVSALIITQFVKFMGKCWIKLHKNNIIYTFQFMLNY